MLYCATFVGSLLVLIQLTSVLTDSVRQTILTALPLSNVFRVPDAVEVRVLCTCCGQLGADAAYSCLAK